MTSAPAQHKPLLPHFLISDLKDNYRSAELSCVPEEPKSFFQRALSTIRLNDDTSLLTFWMRACEPQRRCRSCRLPFANAMNIVHAFGILPRRREGSDTPTAGFFSSIVPAQAPI